MLHCRHVTFCFAMLAAGFLSLPSSPAEAAPLPPACVSLVKTMDAQPAGPVFLASYPSVKSGPLQGAAFLYDNAVAVVALIACGAPEKAQRIGDAILLAQAHDRYWHDGRLRNGYLADPVGTGPVKLAGWWDAKQNMWVEDRYQVGSDNGNMAWAILALLALDKKAADRRYLDGAVRIGNWVTQWSKDSGGFTGGTFAHEPVPVVESWKSTEHNTDLAAAFAGLAQATGDSQWLGHARIAQRFVRAMWTRKCSCFAVGTKEDGKTRNPYLALDAQIWPLLALPGAAHRYQAALATVQDRLSDQGGFAYSEAKEGLWTEGTAQVALLEELSGKRRRRALVAGGRYDARGGRVLLCGQHADIADRLHAGNRSHSATAIFSYRASGGAGMGGHRGGRLQSLHAPKRAACYGAPVTERLLRISRVGGHAQGGHRVLGRLGRSGLGVAFGVRRLGRRG